MKTKGVRQHYMELGAKASYCGVSSKKVSVAYDHWSNVTCPDCLEHPAAPRPTPTERSRARQQHYDALRRGEHVSHRYVAHMQPINGFCCMRGAWRSDFCDLCDENWPCPTARNREVQVPQLSETCERKAHRG